MFFVCVIGYLSEACFGCYSWPFSSYGVSRRRLFPTSRLIQFICVSFLPIAESALCQADARTLVRNGVPQLCEVKVFSWSCRKLDPLPTDELSVLVSNSLVVPFTFNFSIVKNLTALLFPKWSNYLTQSYFTKRYPELPRCSLSLCSAYWLLCLSMEFP